MTTIIVSSELNENDKALFIQLAIKSRNPNVDSYSGDDSDSSSRINIGVRSSSNADGRNKDGWQSLPSLSCIYWLIHE